MKVFEINKEHYRDWVLNKHYAKRMPSITYAYGLFIDEKMVGVASYGRPMAHSLVKGAFKGKWMDTFLELNRLCVNDGLEKNTLSFFLSKTLKMLPKPNVVVSYADTSMNHNGYIYQATNWIYTGLSAKRKDYKIKGYEHLHSASIMDKVRGVKKGKVQALKDTFGEGNVYTEDRPRKHRYFYFLGSKSEKKDMLRNLSYKIEQYPKGENKRYDASYQPKIVHLRAI